MPSSIKSDPLCLPGRIFAAEDIDTTYLETLVGYNARCVSLKVIEHFTERMADYDLSPVDFSVLSLITHDPGIASRQVCSALKLLPPNLAGKINAMEKRELLARLPHPHDGRGISLYLIDGGQQLMEHAEKTATQLEFDAASNLSTAEKKSCSNCCRKFTFKLRHRHKS